MIGVDNTYLCHYGRKGMKWGQHIFGRDNLESRYEKASRKLKKTKYAYSGIKGLVYKNRLKKVQFLHNSMVEEHEKLIEQGVSSGKFVDKNGNINALGCLMCGIAKNDHGEYVAYAKVQTDRDVIIRDAFWNYQENRMSSLTTKEISSAYRKIRGSLDQILKKSYHIVSEKEKKGDFFSEDYYIYRSLLYRAEELRYFARDNHLENFVPTEHMILNAFNPDWERHPEWD